MGFWVAFGTFDSLAPARLALRVALRAILPAALAAGNPLRGRAGCDGLQRLYFYPYIRTSG